LAKIGRSNCIHNICFVCSIHISLFIYFRDQTKLMIVAIENELSSIDTVWF
jgi:hypothetical protein